MGEEDEISIKDAANMIVEAMHYTGPVIVSLKIFFMFIIYTSILNETNALFNALSRRPSFPSGAWAGSATVLRR